MIRHRCLQKLYQGLACCRYMGRPCSHNLLGADLLSVEVFIRAVVGPQGRALQGHPSESAPRPRPRQDLRLQTSDESCRSRILFLSPDTLRSRATPDFVEVESPVREYAGRKSGLPDFQGRDQSPGIGLCVLRYPGMRNYRGSGFNPQLLAESWIVTLR